MNDIAAIVIGTLIGLIVAVPCSLLIVILKRGRQ